MILAIILLALGLLAAAWLIDSLTEWLERREQRRHNAWLYGHPKFFVDLKRTHYPEDLK